MRQANGRKREKERGGNGRNDEVVEPLFRFYQPLLGMNRIHARRKAISKSQKWGMDMAFVVLR